MPPTNLVNVEAVAKTYGTRVLLDGVSLGVADGERIGVVGRNGGGKTTLVSILAGALTPDRGRVTHTGGLRVGLLAQADVLDPSAVVRDVVLGDVPDHVWASDPRNRGVVGSLLAGIAWDASVAPLSGGERRRVALAALLVDDPDLLVLDEPTNHLDVEGVDWLAGYLAERRGALVDRDARPLVPRRRVHPDLGGRRRCRACVRGRLCGVRAGASRARASRVSR